MAEAPTACIRGCTRFGWHTSDCPHDDPRDHTCRGCMPRSATDGLLCWPCHRRLELMLTDAPTVHDWLTAHLPRGSITRPKADHEWRRSEGEAAPTPLDLNVLDHIDVFTACLLGWQDHLADDLGLQGAPERTAASAARWLLTHQPTLERRPWAADAWAEIADVTSTAHALAPWRPTATRIPGIPCPECEHVSLMIFGGDEDVTCTTCRTMIPPGRYLVWVRMLLAEQAEKVPA